MWTWSTQTVSDFQHAWTKQCSHKYWLVLARGKWVLSKVFGLQRGNVAGDRINLHSAEIYNFCSSQTITRLINWGGWDGRRKCDVWARKEMRTEFWWGLLKEIGQLEHVGVGRAVILKTNVNNEAGSAFCGLICSWIGTSGGLLNTLMKCLKFREIFDLLRKR